MRLFLGDWLPSGHSFITHPRIIFSCKCFVTTVSDKSSSISLLSRWPSPSFSSTSFRGRCDATKVRAPGYRCVDNWERVLYHSVPFCQDRQILSYLELRTSHYFSKRIHIIMSGFSHCLSFQASLWHFIL